MKPTLVISLSCLVLIIISLFYVKEIMAPANFPIGTIYTLESGSGLNSVSSELKDKNIISSPFWFKVFSVLFAGTKGLKTGDYVLDTRENVIFLSYRITHADFGLTPVKLTFREGLNTTEMSNLFPDSFFHIKPADFVMKARAKEGYLFPDTYLLLPNVSTDEIIEVMTENFDNKIKDLKTDIVQFKKPLDDIIKIASIIELEARTKETRQTVAGILWKRLDLGMPLQVDVSFKYINGKTTKSLTLEDLKIDSPYNTYLYKGLPPTPISNPGLVSIKAAITPIATPYLYFLSDDQGNMHYAKTYSEHLQNKKLYLQ